MLWCVTGVLLDVHNVLSIGNHFSAIKHFSSASLHKHGLGKRHKQICGACQENKSQFNLTFSSAATGQMPVQKGIRLFSLHSALKRKGEKKKRFDLMKFDISEQNTDT